MGERVDDRLRTKLPPHRVVRIHVSIPDRPQHILVAVAPKVLLLHDDIHEVLLGEGRGLPAPVAVEDPEEGVLQVLVVRCRLERHAEHVLHVFAAALITVAGHPQINADTERHVDVRGMIRSVTTTATTSPRCEELSVYGALITHSIAATYTRRTEASHLLGRSARASRSARNRERQWGDGGGRVTLRSATGRRRGLADSSECPKRERGVPFPSSSRCPRPHTHACTCARVLSPSLFLSSRASRRPRFHRHEHSRRSPTILEKRLGTEDFGMHARSRCMFSNMPPAIDRRGPPIARTALNFDRVLRRRFSP